MRHVRSHSGSVFENSIGMALSIFPEATSGLAFKDGRPARGHARRLAGVILGLAAIPWVLLERTSGVTGTMIYLVKKDEHGPQ
jgi:hypothetical protein